MSQELLPCYMRNVTLLDGCARCCLCLLWKESETLGQTQRHLAITRLANP